MHDPMTIAFEIKSPFFKWRVLPNGYRYKERNTLITIWHNDPESDGSDDSCGYSYPNPSERDKKIVAEIANLENYNIGFSSPYLPVTLVDPRYDYPQQTMGDCLASVAWAWQQIAWHRDDRRNLTAGELWRCNNLAVNPVDNLRHILTDFQDSDRVKRFLYCVMRSYLKYHRPWYRHPRWHIHHWRIQWNCLGWLKRLQAAVKL